MKAILDEFHISKVDGSIIGKEKNEPASVKQENALKKKEEEILKTTEHEEVKNKTLGNNVDHSVTLGKTIIDKKKDTIIQNTMTSQQQKHHQQQQQHQQQQPEHQKQCPQYQQDIQKQPHQQNQQPQQPQPHLQQQHKQPRQLQLKQQQKKQRRHQLIDNNTTTVSKTPISAGTRSKKMARIAEQKDGKNATSKTRKVESKENIST